LAGSFHHQTKNHPRDVKVMMDLAQIFGLAPLNKKSAAALALID